MSSKTIISPQMPLRSKGTPSTVTADKPCMGIGERTVCHERATCQRHAAFLAGAEGHTMRTGRVGDHACHYRIEVVK